MNSLKPNERAYPEKDCRATESLLQLPYETIIARIKLPRNIGRNFAIPSILNIKVFAGQFYQRSNSFISINSFRCHGNPCPFAAANIKIAQQGFCANFQFLIG